VKIKLLILVGLLSAVNFNAYALGLGEIKVKSALNEPLDAVIELTGTVDLDENQIQVNLGSPADFERMGISRESVLLQLKFITQLKDNPPTIAIRSEKPIREPFLNFIIDVQSPKAQMMKEYTVFLNPSK